MSNIVTVSATDGSISALAGEHDVWAFGSPRGRLTKDWPDDAISGAAISVDGTVLATTALAIATDWAVVGDAATATFENTAGQFGLAAGDISVETVIQMFDGGIALVQHQVTNNDGVSHDIGMHHLIDWAVGVSDGPDLFTIAEGFVVDVTEWTRGALDPLIPTIYAAEDFDDPDTFGAGFSSGSDVRQVVARNDFADPGWPYVVSDAGDPLDTDTSYLAAWPPKTVAADGTIDFDTLLVAFGEPLEIVPPTFLVGHSFYLPT